MIIISDPTLRDGNHSVKHTISLDSIAKYCKAADEAGIPIIEVGHGNGLGASSILIGQATHTDAEMLKVARQNIIKAKLQVHIIPGLATIKKDIIPAIEAGVDIFRIACHVTEATITRSHIEFLKSQNKTVHGVLMMSALATVDQLSDNAKLLESYGAEAIIIMDSTGTYMPCDVEERIYDLIQTVGDNIKIGFHGHNNLGLAIANSLIAVENGATIIDATIRGFGAGAGNTQIECLIPVLEKMREKTNIDFAKLIKLADEVEGYLVKEPPITRPINVLTGLNKIFSGFEKPIIKAAKLYGVEYSSLIFELGNRKLVAGQEDLITEVAQNLKKLGNS